MGKVIRLTESDLTKIVKRILKETILTEQDSPKTIKGFLKSTRPGGRGKETNDFVVIQLGDNMRHGYYPNCVIIQTNIKDSNFKVGTKGTIGRIDKRLRTCEFSSSSSGKIDLVNIEFNKSPHLY